MKFKIKINKRWPFDRITYLYLFGIYAIKHKNLFEILTLPIMCINYYCSKYYYNKVFKSQTNILIFKFSELDKKPRTRYKKIWDRQRGSQQCIKLPCITFYLQFQIRWKAVSYSKVFLILSAGFNWYLIKIGLNVYMLHFNIYTNL